MHQLTLVVQPAPMLDLPHQLGAEQLQLAYPTHIRLFLGMQHSQLLLEQLLMPRFLLTAL